MKNVPKCPKCSSEFTYENEDMYICSECAHEWLINTNSEDTTKALIVKDAFGNILKNGDSVTIIKDIKVKGTSSVQKLTNFGKLSFLKL